MIDVEEDRDSREKYNLVLAKDLTLCSKIDTFVVFLCRDTNHIMSPNSRLYRQGIEISDPEIGVSSGSNEFVQTVSRVYI